MRHWRYLLFLFVLFVGAFAMSSILPILRAILVAFDIAVMAFVLACVGLWKNGSAEVMRDQSERDDAGQFLLLILTGLISSAMLITLSTLFLQRDVLSLTGVVLLVTTLLATWTFVNLIYAFHYARLYYSRRESGDFEGLDFPGQTPPDFADFVNFAFVIGMTCQTADIEITDSKVRRISTFHGLFAFAFNLGILALTVNVLASA